MFFEEILKVEEQRKQKGKKTSIKPAVKKKNQKPAVPEEDPDDSDIDGALCDIGRQDDSADDSAESDSSSESESECNVPVVKFNPKHYKKIIPQEKKYYVVDYVTKAYIGRLCRQNTLHTEVSRD